jgi:hypothetical protein
MSKNKKICIVFAVVLMCFASYALLMQSTNSIIQTISPTTSTPAVISTPPSVVVAPTTSTPAIKQISPEMAHLLELIKECRVEGIHFSPTYGGFGAFKGIEEVILKDGSSFENPSAITKSDMSFFRDAVMSINEKCPIRIGGTIMDR